MNLLGLKVKHKAFGIGEIVEIENNYITVAFETKTTKFVYPNAFETFIQALDEDVQEAITSEIKEAKKIVEAKKQLAEAIRKAEDAIRRLDNAKISKKGLPEAIQIGENAGRHLEESAQIAEAIASIQLRDTMRIAEDVSLRLEEKIQEVKDVPTGKTRILDEMFGEDYHSEKLAREPILTYQQVEDEFGIRISGFGRGINLTDSTVVLVSSIKKGGGCFVYHDRWTADGDYIYSGEGRVGDQVMTKGNLAIKNAARDGKTIHLFVKFSPKEYYYQGVFVLVDYTYENDKDENGDIRKEYKFRLRKAK